MGQGVADRNPANQERLTLRHDRPNFDAVNPTLDRRQFLGSLATGTGALLAPLPLAQAADALSASPTPQAPARRFTIDLTAGAIGVDAAPRELLRLAQTHGFESVQLDVGAFLRASSDDRQAILAAQRAAGLKWGASSLPTEFRRDDEKFRGDLAQLPSAAAALKDAGVARVGTWLSPADNVIPRAENFDRHVTRLRGIAKVLRDHGLRFGLEYVGTPSLRKNQRHPFVHNLAQARELIAAIDVPGTGLVLDSWHWWTAGDSKADLLKLKNADVIAVDLNDAPAAVALEDQRDNRRELPAATGVIPVRDFLGVLLAIGYDGPVRAEPFNAPLNALDNEAACAKTVAAIRQAIALTT